MNYFLFLLNNFFLKYDFVLYIVVIGLCLVILFLIIKVVIGVFIYFMVKVLWLIYNLRIILRLILVLFKNKVCFIGLYIILFEYFDIVWDVFSLIVFLGIVLFLYIIENILNLWCLNIFCIVCIFFFSLI